MNKVMVFRQTDIRRENRWGKTFNKCKFWPCPPGEQRETVPAASEVCSACFTYIFDIQPPSGVVVNAELLVAMTCHA